MRPYICIMSIMDTFEALKQEVSSYGIQQVCSKSTVVGQLTKILKHCNLLDQTAD